MIFKAIEKHLTDQEFFTYIKFFEHVINRKPIDDDEDDFSLKDLALGSEEIANIFNRIFMSAQLLEVHLGIEHGYKFDEQLEEAKEEASKKPEKEKKELLAIIRKIKTNKKPKIDEIAKVSWIWYEIYDYIRFIPSEYKIPEQIEAIFRTEMDKYLDALINDKLAISTRNYYKFETQKRALIKLIEDDKKIALYGNSFIIQEKIDTNGVSRKAPDFCLIQTVYALQKLGYLKVVNVWESRDYPRDPFDPEKFDERKTPVRLINMSVILEDILIDEINRQYKKQNPVNVFEKLDAKRGILRVAGKEVEISKGGKETYPLQLLSTLCNEPDRYWFEDEILTDWGHSDEEQKRLPKNRVYQAALKVNDIVARATQLEDFLEHNTEKFRINPKYLKSS